MEQQLIYKKQEKMTLLSLLMELPNLVAVTVSALISRSLLVWLDFVDSLGNVFCCGMVTILSHRMTHDLRYTYNYGVGKIEAMTALFSEGVELCGLAIVGISSACQLAKPQRPSDFLIWVVVLKIINVLVDGALLFGQSKVQENGSTYVTKGEYLSKFAAFLFDAGALLSVLLVWLLRNYKISWYVSPVLSLGVSGCMLVSCLKHLRTAISELSDETLPEEEQMTILKALARHNAEYTGFGSIKSRSVGQSVSIDLSISFSPDTPFEAISCLQKALQEELSAQIPNCRLSIVIDGGQEY